MRQAVAMQSLVRTLGIVLNYWILLGVGTLGLGVVLLDAFTGLGWFQEKTVPVIGVTISFLLIFVVVERAGVLQEIQDQLGGPRVTIYPPREAIYSIIPEVTANVGRAGAGEKQLLIAGLHGHSGRRMTVPSPPIPAFDAFDAAMQTCINSSGPGMWVVKFLTNVTSEERLAVIEKWLDETHASDGFELRAFSVPDAIAHLSPLVVGSEHVFLALEDPRYYRVSRGLGIESREAAALVTEYFNSLWHDPRVFILRSAVGVEQAALEKLRARVRGAPAKVEEPPGST